MGQLKPYYRNAMLVDSTDIDAWAARTDSRVRFPDLVRRLILATVQSLDSFEMPVGEDVDRRGWDGQVKTTTSGHPYVPEGVTGWELSSRADSATKANTDYKTRSDDPEGLDPSSTTFIYATPRDWAGKQGWANAKRQEGHWADVRAYDSIDVETWLTMAPGVANWLARHLEKQPADTTDLEGIWEAYAGATSPALSADIFAADRDDQREELVARLKQAPQVVSIKADTEDEALAFLYAVIEGLPELERDYWLSRTVAAHTDSAWRQLAASHGQLLLVSRLSDAGAIASATGRGHFAILPLARHHPADTTTIELPTPRSEALVTALSAMGVDPSRLDELASLGRRGMAGLRRELARSKASLMPDWAKKPVSRALIAAILAGRWSDSREPDQAVLSGLAGRSYGAFREEVIEISERPDSPIRRLGDAWFVSSRKDSWALLADNIGRAELETFASAAETVLGEVDPRFQLPSDERWTAAIHGKVLEHSDHLREGMAQTLALLGAIGGTSDTQSGESWACAIIAQLIPNARWDLWASISQQLPTLAEACPEGFLDCIEEDLDAAEPAIVALFSQSSDGVMGDWPEAGLVWAIERLAWPPHLLPRAADLMARLADLAGAP